MRAVVCQHAELGVQDLPEPTPVRGQVRLRVSRCGICGTDLHARHSADDLADVMTRAGYDRIARPADPVVFGHEFCGEVAEYGPKTKATIPVGTPVVALPLLRNGEHIDPIGLSRPACGAYAEQVVVERSLMMAVPNGLAPDVAALTEPLAVALHAVRRSDVKKRDVAIVIGCGPVGLGVILMLKASRVKTVVAADFSPGRRALAAACGADVVVDPAQGSPYDAVQAKGLLPTSRQLSNMTEGMQLALDAKAKIDLLPLPWWRVWGLAETVGAQPKAPVIFECVGVPGLIEQVFNGAPLFSRVIVVGFCIGSDTFTPTTAMNKELDLRFVIGYTPPEFRETLHMLAEGTVDPRPLLTGTVGLDGVAGAFEALGDPEAHAKILVDPASSATDASESQRPT